ncbi:MAG: hypothetical protein JWN52_5726 [Actinomycetia bacterium]|nr:hypothetical protein [Actinomycetes bacterium]
MALDNAFPTPASQLTTMAQWEVLFSLMGSGVVPGVGNEFAPSLNSGSRLVIAATGAASLRGFFTNGATSTSTSAPAASGSPRIDRYVLRLDRTAVTAANWIKAVIIAGTPGATPQAPALSASLTGSWDLPICRYRAETNGSLSGLVDERYWLSGPVVKFTSTARPSASVPRLGIEVDSRRVLWADGSAWNSLNQDTGWVNLAIVSPNVPSGVPLAVEVIDGIAHLTGAIDIKATPSTDKKITNLPVGTVPSKTITFVVYQDGGVVLLATAYASGSRSGQLWLTGNLSNASNNTTLRMNTTWPVL